MERINSIALDKSDYKSEEEFWNDVKLLMQMLVKAEYTVSIRYEDCNIYVIEYDYTNMEMAHFIPWVDAEKYEKAMDFAYGVVEDASVEN